MRRALRGISVGISVAALGVAACSRAGRPATSSAVVSFANESLDMATVYAIRGVGEARRIGSVAAGQTETLRLPTDLTTAGPITIVAVPLAGNRAASTGQISIRPGDRLVITLPMTQNTLMVFPAPPQ